VSKNLKKWLSIASPLLLGFAFMGYTYWSFTPDQVAKMKSHFVHADYFYICLSLGIAALGYIFRAYRWRYTIEHLGYKSDFKTNLMAVCIAYFVNMSIPRSGEISRALLLKKYQDIPFDKGLGTIIAERVVDLIILLICIALALILQFQTLNTFLIEIIPVEKLIFVGFLGLILFIGMIFVFKYAQWPWILNIKSKLSGVILGVMSVFQMKNKWPFLGYTLAIWTVYILMFYVTIFALPETENIGFGVVVTAFVVGSLAIVFSNSGFGVYPVLIAKILALYGVPFEAGNAFGWIGWSSQIILSILLGVASFLLLPIIHAKK
jgi:glycosyltransferase 2 family protein